MIILKEGSKWLLHPKKGVGFQDASFVSYARGEKKEDRTGGCCCCVKS